MPAYDEAGCPGCGPNEDVLSIVLATALVAHPKMCRSISLLLRRELLSGLFQAQTADFAEVTG